MYTYISAEQRVPENHPLRPIRTVVDAALRELSRNFARMYAKRGRPSIPPEWLLRALLLQVLFCIRSERMLMEQLDYNLLYISRYALRYKMEKYGLRATPKFQV